MTHHKPMTHPEEKQKQLALELRLARAQSETRVAAAELELFRAQTSLAWHEREYGELAQ